MNLKYWQLEQLLTCAEIMISLLYSGSFVGQRNLLSILKRMFNLFCSILHNQDLSEQVKLSILVSFQTLTAEDSDSILSELRNLNFIQLILDLLFTHSNNPILVGAILTIITNLALNDQNNIKIRLVGAHVIGKILMENCPSFNKDKPKKYVRLEK